MGTLVDYSDSESEEEKQEDVKRRKIEAPPKAILNRFSKTPLKVHAKKTAARSEPLETTFAYISVAPNDKMVKEIRRIIEELTKNSPDTKITNLCTSELTRDVQTLHISLSYNMTKTRTEMDALVDGLSRSEILDIFPLTLCFQEDVRVLSSDEGTKHFLALVLDEQSTRLLQPLVAFFNTHNTDHPYDPTLLHTSVAVVATVFTLLPHHRVCPLSLPVSSVELTRGRSVCQFPPVQQRPR